MAEKQTCQMCKNDRFAEEMHRCSYCSLEACENCLDVVPWGGDVQFCRGGDCELEYLRNHYNDLRDEVEGQVKWLLSTCGAVERFVKREAQRGKNVDLSILNWHMQLVGIIEALQRRLDNE